MIEFSLPYPPTVNNYFTISHGRKILSPRGRLFHQASTAIVAQLRKEKRIPYGCIYAQDDVQVELTFYRPDNRKRDLDNLIKATLDAITKANIWHDDEQIIKIIVQWGDDIIPNGRTDIKIMASKTPRMHAKKISDSLLIPT